MNITALQNFVHGSLSMNRGDRADVPDAIANDLAGANLVMIDGEKQAPAPENKMAPATKNKAKSK